MEVAIIVRYLSWFVLAGSMFVAGLYLKPRELRGAFKEYKLILRAVLANAVIIPLFGLALYKMIPLPASEATGFLLVVFSFGLPLAVNFAKSVRADIPIVTVTIFALALISSITMPLLLQLFLPGRFSISKSFFFVLLFIILFQLAPLIAGVVVSESQIVRKILLRPLALITGAAGIALLGLVIVVGLAVISIIGPVAPAVVFILTLFSLGVGWILGGPALINRKVLAINSGLRNFPVGLLMATSIFSDTEIAASVAVFAAIMILTVLVFTRLVSRFRREEVWESPVVSS
ncbi:MAG: bile acid:sodium symporter family protein [Nitrososphaerales archaeon]